jgi:hypothetical protein
VRCFGSYRFVRHPIYAGYLLCHLGALCQKPSSVRCVSFSDADLSDPIFRNRKLLPADERGRSLLLLDPADEIFLGVVLVDLEAGAQ